MEMTLHPVLNGIAIRFFRIHGSFQERFHCIHIIFRNTSQFLKQICIFELKIGSETSVGTCKCLDIILFVSVTDLLFRLFGNAPEFHGINTGHIINQCFQIRERLHGRFIVFQNRLIQIHYRFL